MWRAVFAFAFVDNSLSIEEQELLKSYLATAHFTADQRRTLFADMHNPQDVVEMYRHITSVKDKERFCILARAMAWCEGHVDRQEAAILSKVSCLYEPEENIRLLNSRKEAHLYDYYQHYAKAGVRGLMGYPHQMALSA
ncbi:MAG: hypothetical protein GC136_00955 [Alphaproteobacteria bacterium]|nr:hypothetical protein [Alphaproteobacteria bacterium]